MSKTKHTIEIPDRMWELAKEIRETDDPTLYLQNLLVEEGWNFLLTEASRKANILEGCYVFVARSSEICPECKDVFQIGTEIINAYGRYMHIDCYDRKIRLEASSA